jgi:hypothetical protein
MKRFIEILRQANERLDLPQPIKSRIILEMAADLEDLYQFHRRQGLNDSDALREATDAFNLSPEALEQLVEIHTTPFRRFLDRLSAQAQTFWERIFLVTLLLFTAVFIGPSLLRADMFVDAGVFLWPIAGTSLAALYLAVRKTYDLYVKKDHRVRRLRRGLTPLIALAGVDVVIGIQGFVFLLHSSFTLFLITAGPMDKDLGRWMIQSSATAVVSLSAAIIMGIIWFVLANKIAAIERAEVAHLLET